MTCILAIDPGISGALAVYYTDKPEMISLYDAPLAGGNINPHELRRLITLYRPDFAIIERVNAHPKEGVSSVWRFATAYATAVTTVALCDVPYALVTPASWKKFMMLGGGREGKEQARVRAIATFPHSAANFARKKDHGRAEAALLAIYAHTSKKAFQYELLPH